MNSNLGFDRGFSCGNPVGQNGVLTNAKVTNDASRRASEVSCLGRGVPQYLTDAFSDRAPGARSTDK
ncbi:hypothetical protein CRG98_037049 [Punica granatum]|uniref:Uncharacterized protein n=1 Tax=Punica granatum TaxID=22663 RepID=A0A2I0IEX5_PUNGR|nr:hypothetical protein CRG98_037049 [Punica granatum]